MTTSSFVKEYLKEKLGFAIECHNPALFVMLGRSSVIGKDLSEKGLAHETYANFLKISLDGKEPVLNVIGSLVQGFNEYASYNFHIDFNPAKDKLLYHGFYKAFFRLVALAKDNPATYKINISTNLGKVFVNDRPLNLRPGFVAIYIMVLCRSLFGDRKGLPMRKEYETLTNTEKDDLERQYQWVIAKICKKGKKERKPLYPSVQHRMTDIRNSISEIIGRKLIDEVQICAGDYVKTVVAAERVTVDSIEISQQQEWINCFEHNT